MTLIPYGLFYACKNIKKLVLLKSIERIELFYYRNNKKENNTYGYYDNLKDLSILHSEKSLSVGFMWYVSWDYGPYEKYTENDLWDIDTKYIENLFIDRSLECLIKFPNLENLELGESITEVQVYEIGRLEKLKTIKSHALIPPKIENISNFQYMNLNVYVPVEALDAYKADPVWGQFWNLQASGVEDLKDDTNVKIETGRYDINGRIVSDDYDGLVIVKYSDGSCKKTINRSK